ncbi:hypothetical protein evm_014376 [Chilo suppressalis]|nr:hypothetical protein evm_014376 [Chilo suppressalis]
METVRLPRSRLKDTEHQLIPRIPARLQPNQGLRTKNARTSLRNAPSDITEHQRKSFEPRIRNWSFSRIWQLPNARSGLSPRIMEHRTLVLTIILPTSGLDYHPITTPPLPFLQAPTLQLGRLHLPHMALLTFAQLLQQNMALRLKGALDLKASTALLKNMEPPHSGLHNSTLTLSHNNMAPLQGLTPSLRAILNPPLVLAVFPNLMELPEAALPNHMERLPSDLFRLSMALPQRGILILMPKDLALFRSPLSDSYTAPESRSLSQEYGAPASRSNLKTGAFAASFGSARSSPSSTYGAPSARMPSEQYGVPEQYNALSSQGYDYARNSLDELLNQEPANYDFSYKVNDYQTGSDFGHSETRQDNRAEGSYFVVLPDGTKQVVEYEADERGFKPRISVEPADASARAGGYDDNAADLSRAAGGPY